MIFFSLFYGGHTYERRVDHTNNRNETTNVHDMSEQAQSYFLERQNSYHQNLQLLNHGKTRNARKHAHPTTTPVASHNNNTMLQSSSGGTFSTSPSSKQDLDEELGRGGRSQHAADPAERSLLPSEYKTSSRDSPKQYGTSSGNNNRIMRIPSSLIRSGISNTSTGTRPVPPRTIRFQVVVWNIGKLDVVTSSVPMTFRVSLFWNDLPVEEDEEEDMEEDEKEDLMTMDDSSMGEDGNIPCNHNTSSVRSINTTTSSTLSNMTWKMHGRSKAIPQDFGSYLIPPRSGERGGSSLTMSQQPPQTAPSSILQVPPLSILNVATFETIGGAEIDCLDHERRLFRWTAMYRATVLQTDVRVEDFPHDLHRVQLRLAVLSQRSRGRQWDATRWKLSLATEEDSHFSTRVPHGLIVDQVKIPGFAFHRERGLHFEFLPLHHGSFGGSGGSDASSFRAKPNNSNQGPNDEFLRVSVFVLRESGYYDQNVVPLVALLNVVAVSVLTFQDSEFFYRALITLNIAFVEMSIRMTADSHLPSVGYQIKLQRMLNEWFVILMLLVLEGMVVFVLRIYFGINESVTKSLDWITGLLALGHNVWRVMGYYRSKEVARHRLEHGGEDDDEDHRQMKKAI
jgi:hypothetical protein